MRLRSVPLFTRHIGTRSDGPGYQGWQVAGKTAVNKQTVRDVK